MEIHWESDLENTFEKRHVVGACHRKSVGERHWKFTMISEVSISGVQYVAPLPGAYIVISYSTIIMIIYDII